MRNARNRCVNENASRQLICRTVCTSSAMRRCSFPWCDVFPSCDARGVIVARRGQCQCKDAPCGTPSIHSSNRPNRERFMPDGTLDSTFAGAGEQLIDVGNNGGTDYATDALQLSSGQLLIAGGLGAPFMAVLRLNRNGSIDSSFGSNGAAVANVEMNTPR